MKQGFVQLSLPSRGAWIEISIPHSRPRPGHGRSPLGGRGLKFLLSIIPQNTYGRSPLGGRGLKLFCLFAVQSYGRSLPSRGAWIEIPDDVKGVFKKHVAPLSGGVD